MSVRSVKSNPPRKPASSSKPRKPSLSAERLEQLIAEIAERAGVRPVQVSVRGNSSEWDAVLIVNQVGNAERKARFRSIVRDLQAEFTLKADQ